MFQNHFLQGILIQSSDLPGLSAHLRLKASIPPMRVFQVDHNIIAELRTVSEDYFLFNSTFTRQLAEQDSIVNQGTVLHSNVKDGFGAFTAYNFTQDTLHLD